MVMRSFRIPSFYTKPALSLMDAKRFQCQKNRMYRLLNFSFYINLKNLVAVKLWGTAFYQSETGRASAWYLKKHRAKARPVVTIIFISELGLITDNECQFSMFLIKKKYVTLKKAWQKQDI